MPASWHGWAGRNQGNVLIFVLLLVAGMCAVSHGSCGKQKETLVITLVLLRLPDFSLRPCVAMATLIVSPSNDDGIVVNQVPGI